MKYLFLAGLFSLTFNIWATGLLQGGISSGGGASIVCYEDDGKVIKSVEMLDSYEASLLYGLNLVNHSTNHLMQLESAIRKTVNYPTLFRELNMMKDHILSIRNFLPHGVVIGNVNDLGTDEPVLMPFDCKLMGVGFYSISNKLSISRTLFEKMTETQKAIFYMHEITYALSRRFSDADTSAEARRLTAYLFSDVDENLQPFINSFVWEKEKFREPIFINSLPQSEVLVKFNYKACEDLISGGTDYCEEVKFDIVCHDGHKIVSRKKLTVSGIGSSILSVVSGYCPAIGVAVEPLLGNTIDWSVELLNEGYSFASWSKNNEFQPVYRIH